MPLLSRKTQKNNDQVRRETFQLFNSGLNVHPVRQRSEEKRDGGGEREADRHLREAARAGAGRAVVQGHAGGRDRDAPALPLGLHVAESLALAVGPVVAQEACFKPMQRAAAMAASWIAACVHI